jgi:hypothetical protein
MVLLMKTNTSPVLPGEVQEYVHLQRQIHDALRKEHPEWVEPNGESPMCDFLRGVSRNSSKRSREGIQRQERRFSKSMTAITVRIPDESVEFLNVEERRVLTGDDSAGYISASTNVPVPFSGRPFPKRGMNSIPTILIIAF